MTNEIIVIFGRKGCGKTTLLKKIVSSNERVIFFDPTCQMTEGVLISDPQSLIGFLAINFHKKYRVIYQPDKGKPINSVLTEDKDETDYIERHFGAVCQIVNCLYDVFFAVDEVDTVSDSSKCPDSFRSIIARGRHNKISLITTTQRPPQTPRMLTSQADVFISFQQHEPNDIKYLQSFFGDKSQELKDLEKFEYIEYKDGKTSRKMLQMF
ncbi:MAG: AAA family ATPase [Candidatus Omnitrophota bacterium]